MKITKKNPLLGAHMSIAGGVKNALIEGESIGCTAIQIFTASNRQWSFNPLKEEDVQAYLAYKKTSPLQSVISHGSYLINLGSPEPDIAQKSMRALKAELLRCHQLDIPYAVIHPGARLTSSEQECLEKIAHNIDIILADTPKTMVLLENTAGQGSNVGYTFEQLAFLLKKIHHQSRVGICFDTCHAFVAGYDFTSKESYESMWNDFDSIIGLEKLKAIHLNDSKKGIGSHVDRHEGIGQGAIGLQGFEYIMNDDRFIHIPKILETPKEKDLAEDVRNLEVLRSLIK